MLEKIRYVTRRVNRGTGQTRWYWQRPGHPLTRLPDDRADRLAVAERLNSSADGESAEAPGPDTIGGLIAGYCDSDDYLELAPGTLKYYRRYLRDIEGLGPRLPFASFTRRAVINFIESYPKPHQRRQAAAVLKNLFKLARYRGLVTVDETVDLRLRATKPRDRVWSDDEIGRWLDAAREEDPHMTTGFLILQFTAQRPNDVLRMSWPHYSGSAIRLRQQKTNALPDVPVHPVLAAHLDGVARSSGSVTIVSYRGRAVKYARFNERFRRIAERAGIEGAQARDLRRTAMLRMAEAGATVPQIASVSGHSIEAPQQILETYLPRNRELAEIAITRLVEYKKRAKV